MATGITVNGVDLDSIFDLYVQGTSPPATLYTVAGIGDLNTRYAPLVYGTAAALTGYQVNGADFNTLWAAYGTARYSLPFQGVIFNAYTSGNVTSNMLARVTLSINADGTYSIVTIGNNITTTAASGTWLPAGQAASDYQCLFSWSQISSDTSGPATFTNTATSYAACTSNQSIAGSAQVLQTSARDQGGHYTMTMLLNRISTGVTTTTTFEFDIESVGTG